MSQKHLFAKLAEARKAYEATAKPIIEQLHALAPHAYVDLATHPHRLPRMVPTLLNARLTDAQNVPCSDFSQSDDIYIRIEYASEVPLAGIGFAVYSLDGPRVGGFNSYMSSPPPHRIPKAGRYCFTLPARQIAPGKYYLNLSVGTHQGVLLDKVDNCLWFTVRAADIYGTGYLESEGLMQLFGTCEIEDHSDPPASS